MKINTETPKINIKFKTDKIYPELENIKITPTKEEQKFKSEKYGYENITVESIPSKETTMTPNEEEQIKEGMFHKVNVAAIQTQEVEPELNFATTDTLEFNPDTGKYFKKVKINKDTNLIASNIKAGVSIYGVSGNIADTSDADAGENDIVIGKSAYVNNLKIRGVYVPLDTSDATATASDIAKGKTAYVNNEKIDGSMVAFDTKQIMKYDYLFADNTTITELKDFYIINNGSFQYMCRGCTALKSVSIIGQGKASTGYGTFINDKALEYFEIDDTDSLGNISYCFQNCTSLKKVVFPTKKARTSALAMQCCFDGCTALETIEGIEVPLKFSGKAAFQYCRSLKDLPDFDSSGWSYSTTGDMFLGCDSLTDNSLNKILSLCRNATSMSDKGKNLKYLGISQEQAERCKTLSNYAAFTSAGWTTGY